MDSIDRAIIRILRDDGRLTNQDLAARVGLTPAPCLRRVRRLEADGVISGYAAIVNPGAMGRGFEVIIHAGSISQGAVTAMRQPSPCGRATPVEPRPPCAPLRGALLLFGCGLQRTSTGGAHLNTRSAPRNEERTSQRRGQRR